jgi:two-component system response regulator GlrR
MSDNKPRVLLVDDDAGLLRLLSLRLTSAGYDVLAVESGEQALAELAQYELFARVQDREPGLPVLILTAHGTIPDAFDAASRGVFSYLTKPYNSKVLLQHMERALKLSAAPALRAGNVRV